MKKSILAPILIGFGVNVLLTLGEPLGPILFAFGLLSVCALQANLFTGKAGYFWRNRKIDLLKILIINLIFGYLFGILLSIANPNLIPIAQEKIALWNIDLSFFLKSIFCGMIMYICVELYNRGTVLGILYGVSLFIFCGFQHSIANIIILGITRTWSYSVIICIIGNLIGSIIIDILNKET